jgi:hypothetical protein
MNEVTPGKFAKKTIFVNSSAEAVEDAVRLLAPTLLPHFFPDTSKNDFQFDGCAELTAATPYPRRQGFLSLLKTSCNNSLSASATLG